MQRLLIFLFISFVSINSIAQEIVRAKSNLPEITATKAVLEEATGWVLQDNGSWLSEKNKIRLYSSELNQKSDPLLKLGRQNFNTMELHEVLIGDEQYAVFVIKYKAGYFEFPLLRQNFHEIENARYVVFHASKLEEILATSNSFNLPKAINLEVFCSDNIESYDEDDLITQIAYNISRVVKLEEPSKFTMILAMMPIIMNGEQLFRFRYVNLYNQASIYHKYLLPNNQNKHFERSYFEVPYQDFVSFFSSVSVHKTDFNLQEPKTFEDYYNRGSLRLDRLNYEGAYSDFRAALKLRPDANNWMLYALMGSTQHQLKEYSAAIRYFDKAIRLKPSESEANNSWVRNYYNRGLSNLMLENKSEACSDFQKAKSLGLTDKEALKVIKKNCKGKYKIKS